MTILSRMSMIFALHKYVYLVDRLIATTPNNKTSKAIDNMIFENRKYSTLHKRHMYNMAGIKSKVADDWNRMDNSNSSSFRKLSKYDATYKIFEYCF